MTPIETNLLFKVLILISFEDKWVKYKDTILGSEGNDLNPFWEQNKLKSLKSDLYARTVFIALELFKFFKVSCCNAFILVITLFLYYYWYPLIITSNISGVF